jgi:hypothetical protein
MKLLIPILLLAVTSCGPLFGKEDEKVDALDRETVDTVVEDLLTSITRKHEEIGPLFASHLHDMKDAAARRGGFDDWQEFKRGLKATDPGLEVEIAGRITEFMNSLLEAPEEDG